MSVSIELVNKIAHLARIKIQDSELETYKDELNKILDWVSQLQEVNTDDVEPLGSVIFSELPQREDKVITTNTKDEILENAPNSKYGYYVVPQVID
ncbi:Asp-tRNA(Asn)/Glu-tRNA(Gln) amidotransferase subunit GatC [Rickettsiales endosymbiont of Peranema trichophorum]|uniref:Asp-tRNA(Asn)/Glu-tRNA(Gln) amidotransferase subunit GatC n=1 Tax=Rickettsiales endosymbiont of Peranema trichophorum TaxID=2486577 RepID=UPI001023CA0D|nr:Asp-tRNA(Asn)/Glu-tRNA(Gln) amidotransferase subunit GatC [Rickettsiales endosymbiont of Peranema trichophorum]RZI45628.1 Asp-tRNA(Asn)/Glu-tRNA(Gln) amidotransferase subunit GatC [Rickettsiales endosymbiont of Peranema trichophorum]